MAGENPRDVIMEVASEQWIERAADSVRLSRLQRSSHVTGKRYRRKPEQKVRQV